MKRIVDITERAFDTGGAVEKVFKRYGRSFIATEEQKGYAVAVARAIEAGHADVPPVALYEASTGIGKSIGYLVPLAIAATYGQRAVVSTSSLQLQSQILSPGGDFEIAAEVASVLTKATPISAALRKGRGNFIDRDRFLDFSSEMMSNKHRHSSIAEFLAQCHSWLQTTETGDFQELRDLIGGIPSWVPVREISAAANETSDFYDAHLAIAEDADIIITNHALLITYASFNSMVVGEVGDITNLIIDEADMIPVAAERIADDGFPLSIIRSIVSELPKSNAQKASLKCIDRLQKISDEIYDEIEGFGDRFGKGPNAQYLFLTGPDLEKSRRSIGSVLCDLEDALQTVVKSVSGYRGEARLRGEMMFIRHLIHAFSANNIGRFNPVPTLRWSPTQRHFSLLASPINPGSVVGRLWSHMPSLDELMTKSVVLTSASLSVPGSEKDMLTESSIRDFALSLGINKRLNPDFMAKFTPKTFGRAKFVLADPAAPLPTLKEDNTASSNPEWLRYAAEMVAKAGSRWNAKALVLTNSYRDAADISSLLSDMKVRNIYLHEADAKLSDILRQVNDEDGFVLITPAAWEGVNIPNLTDVIVTRVPFARPDSYSNLTKEQGLRAIGVDPQVIRGLLLSASTNSAIKRMHQGWARGIRRADQEVTLWTADARFPLPEKLMRQRPLSSDMSAAKARAAYRRLENAIPPRFREGLGSPYARAKVFEYTPVVDNAKKRVRK